MQAFKHMKVVKVIPPGVIKDNAAFTSYVIDTAQAGGAKELVIAVILGALDANLAVCRVMESETKTDDTTLGGVPAELLDVLDTVVPGDDDDNQILMVVIDLRQPHARYLKVEITAGDGAAGSYVAAAGFFTNVGVPETDIGALAVVEG